MRLNVSATALTVLTALCVSACCTTHRASTSQRFERSAVATRDTVREQVVVEVHDTIRETRTITITKNEDGDTLRLEQVTDRERVRDYSDVRNRNEVVRTERDTVFVEKRDSLQVTAYGLGGGETSPVCSKLSAVSKILKWTFLIIVGLTAYKLTVFGLKSLRA